MRYLVRGWIESNRLRHLPGLVVRFGAGDEVHSPGPRSGPGE